MSDKNMSRRAEVQVSFGGVDITKDIKPYLKSLTYTDNEADETDDLQITLQDRDGVWLEKWLDQVVEAGESLSIEAAIARQNWNGDGSDEVLECGTYELDSVVCSGPPATVKIKATSLSFDAQIRQTEKSKGWEEYNLSGIAGEMASKNGMSLMFLSGNDPHYKRVEQRQMSDIAFLETLCHEAGISLKASNQMLILFDQQEYEGKAGVLTIHKDNKDAKANEKYLSYEVNIGTENVQYRSCRVYYNDPKTGKKIQATARADHDAGTSDQQLEIMAKVESTAEAKQLAEKMLRLHNKNQRGAEFTMPGNPALVAGVTVNLAGWGGWDGKYIIKTATHTVGGSGYTTAISLRKVLEGY